MEGQHVENKIVNEQTAFFAFDPFKSPHVDSNAQGTLLAGWVFPK